MSWRVIFTDATGLSHSPPLRTRTDAMILACDLHWRFVSAAHTSGETISKAEVEAWHRENEKMLKGRAPPRASLAGLRDGHSQPLSPAAAMPEADDA